MPSLSAIKSDVAALSSIQIIELFEYIGQLITINSIVQDLQKVVKRNIFQTGRYVRLVVLSMS